MLRKRLDEIYINLHVCICMCVCIHVFIHVGRSAEILCKPSKMLMMCFQPSSISCTYCKSSRTWTAENFGNLCRATSHPASLHHGASENSHAVHLRLDLQYKDVGKPGPNVKGAICCSDSSVHGRNDAAAACLAEATSGGRTADASNGSAHCTIWAS